MEAQGEEELAQTWRERAERNQQQQTLRPIAARGIDRGLLALGSVAIELVIVLFLVGLRTGARRRTELDETDSAKLQWIPLLRKRDLVMPLLLFAVLLALPFHISTHADAISTEYDAPLALTQDGLAAPHSIYWLENLAESEARDSLLETARAEQQAIRNGEPITDKEPVAGELVDAIYADARQRQSEPFSRAGIPEFAANSDGIGAAPLRFVYQSGARFGLVLSVGGLFIGFSLILYVGFLLGQLLPGAARRITLVVPGGSRRLAPVGAAALVILIAAIGALTGLAQLMYPMVIDLSLSDFGLTSMSHFAPSPSHLWAWLAVAMVAAYQGLMILWALRSGGAVEND